MWRLVLVCVLVLTCFGGCDRGGAQTQAASRASSDRSPEGGTPSGSAAGATPAPSSPAPATAPVTPVAEGPVCKNQRSIGTRGSLIRPGSLRGDVDGDGVPDTVRIAIDPQGPAGCRAFVVVNTAGGVTAAAIPQWEPSPALPAPHLNSLVRIDAAGGDEIVIDVTAGASTQFEGVYAYSGGKVGPLRVIGVHFTGLFPYGGSVGHLDGEACTSGLVVVSAAVARGPGLRYAVVRRFFHPGDGYLVLAGGLTEHRVLRPSSLTSLPEFSGAPFAGCGRTA